MFILLCFSTACVKKSVPSGYEPYGLDYYPLKEGKYVVYDVDSTVFITLPQDTFIYKYRIKEKIADTYTDNQGQPVIRLERYIKNYNPLKSYDSIAWTIKEVWSITADKRSVQLVESNTRFTKLIFPVSEKSTWNGNAFNTMEPWQYAYDYVDRVETINGIRFDKVCMVKQKLFSTLISYESYCEKYSRGTGLVYREMQNVMSSTIVPGVPVLNRINSGFIYKQYFVSQGYE